MSTVELLDSPAVVTAPRPPIPRPLRAVCEREERRLLQHPFLRRCASGDVTMGELRRYLVQHGHYGRHFTRFLCALISQLPDGDDVMRLAGNLAEELGFGDGRGVPHARLYAEMLEQQFGLSLELEPISPQTQTLVDTMFMLCHRPTGVTGLGALCLGAEAVVPALYQRILDGFAHHGIGGTRLAFFQIHISCDDDHAQTMFEILGARCGDPSAVETVAAAASTAISARMRMLDGVLDHPIMLGD